MIYIFTCILSWVVAKGAALHFSSTQTHDRLEQTLHVQLLINSADGGSNTCTFCGTSISPTSVDLTFPHEYLNSLSY